MRRGNQIAVQFHGRDPEQADAESPAHAHLLEPRTKNALVAHVGAGGADLDDLAVRAAELRR
ncbi:hypothetical protein GCM10009609_42530 [Pseudonocardia aurantiaca]|uniref:Uncharacterized protein n=1 Tax=Pseudonocardia aurantiaca TaxID=75290 RepID=A0ABW4FNQ2_9PSEU